MKRYKVIGLAALSFFIPGSALALDPVPQEEGWSGFVRAGAGVMRYKSNTIAGNGMMSVGQETISSLTAGPETETTGMGLVNFDLAYTFAATRTQLTLGSQMEDVARLDHSQQAAVKQELPDGSILQGGFLFTSFPTEVWADPYVVNSARQETDRTALGGAWCTTGFLAPAWGCSTPTGAWISIRKRAAAPWGLRPGNGICCAGAEVSSDFP